MLARTGRALVVPCLAVVLALLVSGAVVAALGLDPLAALAALVDFGPNPQAQANQLRTLVNGTVPLFLSGLAVSVAFRMNLFNIGVEGQYRIASVVAAGVGAAIVLPAPLHTIVIVAVAMLAGGAYAAIPAILKVTRGVNEVITTIMLNAIAIGIAGLLVRDVFSDPAEPGNPQTRVLPESARIPGFGDFLLDLGIQPPTRPYTGFIFLAVVVGVAVAFLVNRTRFGFELRAAGANLSAAAFSGIPAKSMIVRAMVLSGALAGLVGLPELLSDDYRYGFGFTAGLGFSGIAVALLGRNSVVGITFAALLFSFISRAGPSLEGQGIPASVATIVQGTIVLSVVIVNEVARRRLLAREEQRARAPRDAQEVAA